MLAMSYGRSHVIYISPITPTPRQLAKCSSREPGRDLILLHIQPGMTSGSLLIQDVEIQATACASGVDRGLQLPGRARWTIRPASAAMRSRGEARRVLPGSPGAGMAAGPTRRAAPSQPPDFGRRAAVLRRVISEPGVPAVAECAVDQGLVAADRDIRADLEVSPVGCQKSARPVSCSDD